MSPGPVHTLTRAAKAPEALGLSAASPWVGAAAAADSALVSDCVGSAGCIRLSSRQVSSTLYSMSTRQCRFLELYSTRLIRRPKPYNARNTQKHVSGEPHYRWEIFDIKKLSLFSHKSLFCKPKVHCSYSFVYMGGPFLSVWLSANHRRKCKKVTWKENRVQLKVRVDLHLFVYLTILHKCPETVNMFLYKWLTSTRMSKRCSAGM